MKHFCLVSLMSLLSFAAFAQVTGDTLEVKTFNYSQTYGINQWSPGIRDTVISFPNAPNVSYEKILMLYNMRCKDGKVSTGAQRDLGCGEWDISCNTYIHDSTAIDSVAATTSSHSISNFSGTTFDYTTQPTYTYNRELQPSVVLNSILSETQSTVGAGTLPLSNVIPTTAYNGKTQYLFTATELLAAGVTAGDLNGLMLNLVSGTETANFLRVRIKPTTKTTLTAANPDETGFTEAYFHHTTFTTGQNRLQFPTVFNWDGTSNIIVELSFTNASAGTALTFEGTNTGANMGIYSAGDKLQYFNGSNYIETDSYKGIGGNTARTMEAWINTDVSNKEILSWGINSATEKWILRVNGNGTIRAEVSGGYIYGTTNITDGQWHHVACVWSGSNITSAKLYVDGVLESVGASQSQGVNTNTTTNLTIGHGFNNTYFDGNIDEVRMWNTALSATTIQDWQYRALDAAHPNFSNLQLYYPLNEGTGNNIMDASNNGNSASVQNGSVWKEMTGVSLFKDFQNTQDRPNITFLQGTYNQTIVTDTILDAIENTPHVVNEYQIVPNYGLVKSDSIALVSSNNYWAAGGYEYYYENGVLYDSTLITVVGTITPTTLNYQLRYPMKFEIMSFVTPYGINLNLGANGKTWVYDVTDFAPVLKGNKRMTIERGGQWMEDMDIRFLYIVGTPPRAVLNIEQIWKVDSKTYTSIMADNSFEPKAMMMHPNGSFFKVRSAISGHGQEGEFIPRGHFLNVNGGTEEFAWQVWKECAENPIFPQGGTWIYDRAGWCPGMSTDVEESDITPFVTAGQTATLDYGVYSGSGDSRYIANHQLVAYGPANFTTDAAIVDIVTPSSKVEYSKSSVICGAPTIVIQNTGATALTSATIEYWVNSAATKQTYTWSGNLAFMEKETVLLPVSANLWMDIAGTNNTFYAEISAPNAGTDEYSFNNKMTTDFAIPDVVPATFAIRFRTNSQGNESRYYIYDDLGNTVFARQLMTSNTEYRDTFSLPIGCYSLVVEDSDDDGIDFWANNDGAGYCKLYRTDVPLPIKTLEPDFGGSITYNFTVEFPLPTTALPQIAEVKLFPNPTSDYFVIENEDIKTATIELFNVIGQRVTVPSFLSENQRLFKTQDLPKGIYFVNIKIGETLTTRKVIIE